LRVDFVARSQPSSKNCQNFTPPMTNFVTNTLQKVMDRGYRMVMSGVHSLPSYIPGPSPFARCL